MRIATILTIFCLFWQSHSVLAQDEDFVSAIDEETGTSDNSDKVQIYVGPDQQVKPVEEVFFAGERRSTIDWANLQEDKYLSLSGWKNHLKLKEKEPKWRRNLMERRLSEKVGYVIECVGECRLYRGLGFSKVDYLSTIREGDELLTSADSYVWVYMLDGTLMRVAPNGSVTLKEINIGKKENFLYARLNAGNILWWSRQSNKLITKNYKETDALFLPLSLYEAKGPSLSNKLDENDLFAFLETQNDFVDKYNRLNKLIEETNKTFSKPTLSFLVFPNGTVLGKDVVAEFVVLTGNKSYFKQRTIEQIGLEGKVKQPELNFFYRGFNKDNSYYVEAGRWYEVGKKGRTILAAENPARFAIGEFVTRNIPSILIAREIMFKRYSSFFHEPLSGKALARRFGYRLWGESYKKGDDLSLRVKFLKEYTRRVETTNLLVAEQFKKKIEDEGDSWIYSQYNPGFYRKAMGSFYNYRDGVNILGGKNESLNSERKPFWKKIHGIRD
jgi:hypothetical protein